MGEEDLELIEGAASEVVDVVEVVLVVDVVVLPSMNRSCHPHAPMPCTVVAGPHSSRPSRPRSRRGAVGRSPARASA